MAIAFKLLFLFNLVFISPSDAIVYIPDHTKVLFTEIDGWVRGEITDLSYKKVNSEKVYTVLSVSVDEFSGLAKSQITNLKNFKVHFPGGLWQGVNIKYSGAPKFMPGEQYIFLLNKKKGGFFVNGFSAGAIADIPQNDELISELKRFSSIKFNEINTASEIGVSIHSNKQIKTRMPAKASGTTPVAEVAVDSDVSITLVVFLVFLLLFIFLFVGRNENFKN